MQSGDFVTTICWAARRQKAPIVSLYPSILVAVSDQLFLDAFPTV
jgi:hypothetical protein